MRVERLLWHARSAVVLLGVSGEARAHGAFPALVTFYSGVLHPAVVPAHPLALLAISLFAGRRGLDYIEQALLLLATAAVAFSMALDSAPESAGERVGALSGTFLGVFVLFLWFSGPVTLLTGPRQRIGLRIAGSWLSAISLLVLALAVRDGFLLAS